MHTVSVRSEHERVVRWLTYAGLWPRDGPKDMEELRCRTCEAVQLLDVRALQAVHWLVMGLALSAEAGECARCPHRGKEDEGE